MDIGQSFEWNIIFSENFILDSFWDKNRYDSPNQSDSQGYDVEDSVDWRSRCRYVSLPEEVSTSKEEQGKLEGNCYEINQILTKSNRVGVSSEEIILVNPVLDDKNDNEVDGPNGENEAIPAHHIAVNDVEGVILSIWERWVLKSFVQLNLEEVDWFLFSVFSSVEEVWYGVAG